MLFGLFADVQSPGQSATGDIQLLAKHAVEDRLAAKNLPDGHLLGVSTRIAIRAEMPRAMATLGRDALPQRAGIEFYLISQAAAQTEADRIREAVPFIVVDQPSIAGDTATIALGVDVVFPTEPRVDKLCCCTGQAQFERKEGRWRFVKWTEVICA